MENGSQHINQIMQGQHNTTDPETVEYQVDNRSATTTSRDETLPRKQTSNSGKELRYHLGKAMAQEFYAEKGIMEPKEFYSTSWEDLV